MSKIKPALSAEEWVELAWARTDGVSPRIYVDGLNLDGVTVRGEERHAVAALALIHQPYGFRREDVNRLTLASRGERDAIQRAWMYDLAARIAALLPPRA